MDTITYSACIAGNVNKAIKNADLSILAASEKTGIPRTTLTRHLEHPDTSPFNVIELDQIASITKTTVSDLIRVDFSGCSA